MARIVDLRRAAVDAYGQGWADHVLTWTVTELEAGTLPEEPFDERELRHRCWDAAPQAAKDELLARIRARRAAAA